MKLQFLGNKSEELNEIMPVTTLAPRQRKIPFEDRPVTHCHVLDLEDIIDN